MKSKKKVSKKNAIPQEIVDKIHAMKPEDLAVELSREQLAVDALLKQKSEDSDIIKAKEDLEAIEGAIDSEDDVVKARVALEEALSAHRGDDYDQAKETLKAANHIWDVDLKDRRKKIKFMKETIKKHIDSGALKLKP